MSDFHAHLDRFALNEAGLRSFLSHHGPVGAELARIAIRVESRAKENATGRPGPNVITGRLRGSITWEPGEDERGAYVDIGTNVEYARRLELGFVGTDSLGRTYNQPPYPFLVPALNEVAVG